MEWKKQWTLIKELCSQRTQFEYETRFSEQPEFPPHMYLTCERFGGGPTRFWYSRDMMTHRRAFIDFTKTRIRGRYLVTDWSVIVDQ